MRCIVNIDRVISYSQKILQDANIQNSNKEAKLIIGHVTKLSQVEILNSKKTLNNNQLKSIFINTGFLRKNEEQEVLNTFKNRLKLNLLYIDASELFLKELNESDSNLNTKNKTYQFINQIKTLLPVQPISSKLGRVLWK